MQGHLAVYYVLIF